MLSWASILTLAGLTATAVGFTPADDQAPLCGTERPSHAFRAAHLQDHEPLDSAIVRRADSGVKVFQPLTIDVYVHIIASSKAQYPNVSNSHFEPRVHLVSNWGSRSINST